MADNELSKLYEQNSDKINTAFHEGAIGNAISGAISGAVGGAIAGRGAGKRAANKVVSNQPTHQTADQATPQPQAPAQSPIGPKPAYMPTANGTQSQSQQNTQTKPQGLIGKAVQGIGNMIKGGVEQVQQTKQQQNDTNAFMNSLGSGAAAAQNSVQDPAEATKYAQGILDSFNQLAALTTQQMESSLALAWFEYAHLTEKKLTADEIIAAIQGFSKMVNGKSVDQFSDNEKQTFLNLSQQIPMIMKTLQQKYDFVLKDQKVQALTNANPEALAQAFQTMSASKEQQGNQLNKNTKPNQLNGVIANAIKGIDDSQMQSLLNATRLIINKYGQVENFTVYSWSDIAELVEALSQFGSPLTVSLDGIEDPDNTTPAGNPPATKQQTGTQPTASETGATQPASEEATQPAAETPANAQYQVGDVIKQIQQNPEAMSQLLTKEPKLNNYIATELAKTQ